MYSRKAVENLPSDMQDLTELKTSVHEKKLKITRNGSQRFPTFASTMVSNDDDDGHEITTQNRFILNYFRRASFISFLITTQH